jgi:uncharacterized protein (DUF1810 family)
MNDPFNLERFVAAQNIVFDLVVAELRRGDKESHWIWYIFPQLAGLGQSSMSRRYAILSRAEAAIYLAHPIRGPRLIECTRVVNNAEGRSIWEIFDEIDAVRFRSSMTLFAQVAGDQSVFAEALRQYFDGHPDTLTLDRL